MTEGTDLSDSDMFILSTTNTKEIWTLLLVEDACPSVLLSLPFPGRINPIVSMELLLVFPEGDAPQCPTIFASRSIFRWEDQQAPRGEVYRVTYEEVH